MPSRTIKESHRPRVSDRTMHCHSWSGRSSGLLFQKTMAPSQQRNGTTGENNRISASHAETKQNPLPGEDHSQSKRLRSNSWAECRDKKGPVSSRGGEICLDIPFNRTFPISRLHVQVV
jgi:hypothetical protein